MPSYELSLILKDMARPELVSVLKRTGSFLLNKGVVLRKIENLGTRALPFKMSRDNQVHRKGSYFVLYFDSSSLMTEEILNECKRDLDIIKPRIYRKVEDFKDKCTLEEEFKPPALRKSVQDILEAGRKLESNRKLTKNEKIEMEHKYFDIYM